MASRDVDQLVIKTRKTAEAGKPGNADQLRQLLIDALHDVSDDEFARSSALFASFRGGQVTLVV